MALSTALIKSWATLGRGKRVDIITAGCSAVCDGVFIELSSCLQGLTIDLTHALGTSYLHDEPLILDTSCDARDISRVCVHGCDDGVPCRLWWDARSAGGLQKLQQYSGREKGRKEQRTEA